MPGSPGRNGLPHYFGVAPKIFSMVLAVMLCVALMPAVPALAYFNFGAVGVYPGSSYLTVQAGSSVSTSVSITPASSWQTQGCGMAECPQVCGDQCFDSSGQCICVGSEKTQYFAQAYASSSNAGVASATLSGGTLTVTGHSAGTATISISASLRQYTDGYATVTVEVSDPAPSAPSTDSSSGGSSASTPSAPSASSTSSPSVNIPTSVSQAAASNKGESGDKKDAGEAEVVETDGGTVHSAEIGSDTDVASILSKVAETDGQAIFWSGESSERPHYSWTFKGEDLSTDAVFDFDPAVSVSKLGTGAISDLMKQSKGGMVLEFSHEGDLPAPATFYVMADDYFADGTELSLFYFDKGSRSFTKEAEGIEVVDGYVSFEIGHCSTWALSDDDLSAYSVQEANTPGAQKKAEEDGGLATTVAEGEGVPAPVIAAAAIAAIAIAAGIVIAVRKRCGDGAQEHSAQKGGEQKEEHREGDAPDASNASDANASDADDAGDSEGKDETHA